MTPEIKYSVFMIDPPWPKRKGGTRLTRPNQGRSLDYKTMPVDGIFHLLKRDIFPLASKDHSVFMWCIDQFLFDAEREMDICGYRRHARIVWDKENGVAPAFTVRYSHEYLVWFYKAKLPKIAVEQRGKFTTVLREKARQHSRKPECGYAMLESLYPESLRLDVFSREARAGWDQYGDQKEFFNVNDA